MGYFSDQQIDAALTALEETTHTALASLLALWRKKAPINDGRSYVPFGSTEEVALFDTYFAPPGAPPNHPHYIPFYGEQGRSRWRQRSYAAKSLQAQRKRLPEIFSQNPGSNKEWALHSSYVANALSNAERSLGKPPISLPALAAWMLRSEDFLTMSAAVDKLVADLGLDRDGLIGSRHHPSVFTRDDTAGIGGPFETEPVDEISLLAVLAKHSAPPASSTTVSVQSSGPAGVVDPEAVPGSWEIDPEKLKNIGGLQGMDEVAFSAAAALRAGDHVIFIGPPGTGKTTLAEALCGAASIPSSLVTATDQWTTFETIGSYFQMPKSRSDGGESIDFLPGLMLDAIVNGRCLIIDELNRADMDKCFGEFFSIATGQAVTLPFRMMTEAGFHRIRLMPKPGIVEDDVLGIPVPSWWRLIGAMNDADKGSLRRLSQAFKRRFAAIPVPIPEDDIYRGVIEGAAARADTSPSAPMDQLLEILTALFATKGKGLYEIDHAMGPAIPLAVIRRAASEWAIDEKRPIGRVLNSVFANTLAPLLSEWDMDVGALTKIIGPHLESGERFVQAMKMWNGR